jgi:hypothetical protein
MIRLGDVQMESPCLRRLNQQPLYEMLSDIEINGGDVGLGGVNVEGKEVTARAFIVHHLAKMEKSANVDQETVIARLTL